jgi:RNA recognition motif-containing protein
MRGAFRGNITVGNLPEDFTDEELAALFDEHGLVLGARIDRDHSDPVQARRGRVALAPASAVERAVKALNNTRVNDCKLKVRVVVEPPPAPRKPPRAKPVAPPPMPAPRPARPVVVEYKTPRRRILTAT